MLLTSLLTPLRQPCSSEGAAESAGSGSAPGSLVAVWSRSAHRAHLDDEMHRNHRLELGLRSERCVQAGRLAGGRRRVQMTECNAAEQGGYKQGSRAAPNLVEPASCHLARCVELAVL